MFGSSIAKFLKLDNLIDNLTGLFESKVELLKVEGKEQLATGLSRVITAVIIAFFFGLVIVFVSTAIALLLADYIGKVWGYTIVAGVHCIVGVILLANKKKLNSTFEKQLKENLNTKK